MADALVTARDAAQKQFKDNAINEAMGAAQASSGKGDAESIQKAFKKFQKTSDYASMSPTERGMVDNIVQNQPLAQRVLQFTGGFAPDLHDLPHMVKTMAGLALGAGVGHIPGLIASTTITSGAKSAANAMAARQVARLGEAVRSGATPASVSRPPTPPGIYTGVGVNAMRQGPQ
jgi:hypothetical protein